MLCRFVENGFKTRYGSDDNLLHDYPSIKSRKDQFKQDTNGPVRRKMESVEELIIESVENDEISLEEATMLFNFLEEN